MTSLPSLRFLSIIGLTSTLFACGDDSAVPTGGSNQGGDNVGAGGNNTGGGESAGGTHAGGEGTGGDNAGGNNTGGNNAGGESAGGGASFQDCQAAANQLVAIFKGCGITVEGEADCAGADYDLVVCAENCAEAAPCGALNGDDPEAAQDYQDCLELCL